MGEYMWIIILIAFLVVAAFVLSKVVSRKNNGGIHSKMMNDLLSESKNIFKDNSSTLENMMSSMYSPLSSSSSPSPSFSQNLMLPYSI